MPGEYMGDIMGDVTSRRGRVDGMEPRANAQVVNAYATTFRNVRLCNIITFKHSRSRYLHYVLRSLC